MKNFILILRSIVLVLVLFILGYILLAVVLLFLGGVKIPLSSEKEFMFFYGHGGFGYDVDVRNIDKPEKKYTVIRTDEEEKLSQERLEKETRCSNDSDCAIYNNNGCVTKNSKLANGLRNLSENDGMCRCLNGPVMFGCIPQSDYEKWSNAQDKAVKQ